MGIQSVLGRINAGDSCYQTIAGLILFNSGIDLVFPNDSLRVSIAVSVISTTGIITLRSGASYGQPILQHDLAASGPVWQFKKFAYSEYASIVKGELWVETVVSGLLCYISTRCING